MMRDLMVIEILSSYFWHVVGYIWNLVFSDLIMTFRGEVFQGFSWDIYIKRWYAWAHQFRLQNHDKTKACSETVVWEPSFLVNACLDTDS